MAVDDIRLLVLKLKHFAMYADVPKHWKEVLTEAAEKLEEGQGESSDSL